MTKITIPLSVLVSVLTPVLAHAILPVCQPGEGTVSTTRNGHCTRSIGTHNTCTFHSYTISDTSCWNMAGGHYSIAHSEYVDPTVIMTGGCPSSGACGDIGLE